MYAETDSASGDEEQICIWCENPIDLKIVETTLVCQHCVDMLRGIGLTNRQIFEPDFLKKKDDPMRD